ncbi:MAG: outer membrane protein OmpA-like peptidoglycan-associated protein [Polaribacter sp.]|jgi:outer membrane protein OmpA-like peptidoglycan-associated protein
MAQKLFRGILIVCLLCIFITASIAQDFKIQLAAFVNRVPFTHFIFMNVYVNQDQNNIYRYYLGKEYYTREQAERICGQVKTRGFTNAQVVDMVKQKEICGFPCPYITKARTFSSSSIEELQMRTLFFDFDRSSLDRDSKIELNRIYNAMKEDKRIRALVQGHTDSKGPAVYNVNLSKRRARAARNYLIARGISSQRITVKVFGESAPLQTNQKETKDSPLGRKYNRRVVVALYNELGEIVKDY